MENESSISLGGTIILLALFLQTIFFGGKKHFESILHHSQSFYKISILQKKLKRLYELKMCVGGEEWGKKLLLVGNILHCTKMHKENTE